MGKSYNFKPHGFAKTWPEHLVSGRGRFQLWFVQPNFIVTQTGLETAGLAFAQEVVAAIDVVRWRRQQSMRAAGGLVILHDWATISNFNSEARRYMGDAWKRNVKSGEIRAVVTAMKVNPMVRLAFSVINLAATLVSSKTENSLVSDVTPYLERFDVGIPRPDEPLDAERELLATRDQGNLVDSEPPATTAT